MVKHALREGTARGGSAESLGETERLGDGEVSLDHDERSSSDGLLTNDHTATLGEAAVNATYSIVRGLDFNQEDGLLEAGFGSKLSGEEDTAGCGGDLTSSAMDSISVEGDILEVEAATTESLVAHDTFLGSLLEGRHARVLDFAHELALLGDINKEIGTSGLGTEAPDLLGIIGVPLVLILEDFVANLDVLLGIDLLVLNGCGKLVAKGGSTAKDSVMLIGGLGEARLTGLSGDSFLVGNNGVTLLELTLGELFLEILKADLDVKLTATSDNVLT